MSYRLVALCLSLPSLFLQGCGGIALKSDFTSYSGTYADIQNHQMLLNLARLDNGHPPYFLAVGEIRSDHEFSSGIASELGETRTRSSGAGSITESSNTDAAGLLTSASRSVTRAVGGVLSTTLSGGGQITASRKESPKFQFIPMNSEQTARQLLEPVPPDVFYTLFQQGWSADLLMRVLVERVEVKLPSGKNLIMVNSPVRGSSLSFTSFLGLAEMVREFQSAGALTLNSTKEFVSTSDSVLAAPSPDAIHKAAEQQMGWRRSSFIGWELGNEKETPVFSLLEGNRDAAVSSFRQKATMVDESAVQNFLQVFQDGLRLSASNSRSSNSGASSRLVLRSFSRVLDSVATEQNDFEEFLKSDYAHCVPARQRFPVLRTRWSGLPATRPAASSLIYAKQSYAITDPVSAPSDRRTWNRDVFRLLCQVSAQVSVDISKFRRQVLELE